MSSNTTPNLKTYLSVIAILTAIVVAIVGLGHDFNGKAIDACKADTMQETSKNTCVLSDHDVRLRKLEVNMAAIGPTLKSIDHRLERIEVQVSK